jgi:hypothetical protein
MLRENQEDIDYSWQEFAACKGIPTEKFYLGRGEVVSLEVKEKCDICPVKDSCLEHALKYEKYGYWGGTTEKERIKIRASKKISVIKPETVFWYSVSEAKRRTEENRPKIKGRGKKVSKNEEF